MNRTPGEQTNYGHLLSLGIWKMATAIMNYCRDCCAFCPKLRLRDCNDDCYAGLREWLREEFIPGSDVWKEKNK